MFTPDEYYRQILAASPEELKQIHHVQFKKSWHLPMKQITVPKKYADVLRKIAWDLHQSELSSLYEQKYREKVIFGHSFTKNDEDIVNAATKL